MFWTFPRTAVKYAGMDAQWSVLLLVVAAFGVSLIHALLNERFPTMTGPDMLVATLGKWLAKPILFGYLVAYVFFVGVSLFLFVASMQPYYSLTPRWAMVGALCLVAFRMSWHGVESLGRVAAIVHPLTWLGVVSIFTTVIFQAKSFWLPPTVTSWGDTFRGAYYLLPIGLGFNLILMLSPYYEHKRCRSIWYPVISALAGALAVVVTFFAVILNIGWEGARDITFTVPYALQLISHKGWIVERVGILIIIFATAYTVLFASIHIWGMSALTARVFQQKDDDYRRFVIPLVMLVFAIATGFRDNQQAFDVLEQWLVPVSWVLLIAVPLMAYGLALVRGIRADPAQVQKPF